ncbi:histone-fold-containing protein [Xylariaceae sp. FL0016]|nr:histone-fold-containing protein [Xylariaceae sp. FL0016]
MPYNTTAIPPRKEPTGQTQLPLSRVKKIIAQDQDISICSNNAAFVICLATEMFIQYLASEGQNMAKLDRKPRRNIQYKDLANAVSNHDNLQFLEDLVPKTVPYKAIKAAAAARRAQLSGGGSANRENAEEAERDAEMLGETARQQKTNGKKQKARTSLNGASHADISAFMSKGSTTSADDADPNDQLANEMRQAAAVEGDVEMTG